MELNTDIQDILLDAMDLAQQENWNKEQKDIRSVYDTFRIQNLVKNIVDLDHVRLSFFQPENCPEWIEGVGDCKKPDCTFCKIESEIESNEA